MKQVRGINEIAMFVWQAMIFDIFQNTNIVKDQAV